jgi:hypothetical protein
MLKGTPEMWDPVARALQAATVKPPSIDEKTARTLMADLIAHYPPITALDKKLREAIQAKSPIHQITENLRLAIIEYTEETPKNAKELVEWHVFDLREQRRNAVAPSRYTALESTLEAQQWNMAFLNDYEAAIDKLRGYITNEMPAESLQKAREDLVAVFMKLNGMGDNTAILLARQAEAQLMEELYPKQVPSR